MWYDVSKHRFSTIFFTGNNDGSGGVFLTTRGFGEVDTEAGDQVKKLEDTGYNAME